ncbi:hypothetical protein [Fontivita pretiosa]|uniref:hypothetical protein n=1 Tax=Fontivita pretiosa TaxID=2989684 RepID=UPI003D180F5C
MTRRIRTLCGLSGATLWLSCAAVCRAIPAFPGAEGFGAEALGGRGGDVYHVTTLAADPNHVIPGSLEYGLYYKNVPAAGRTIVFDVGGTIYLNQGSTLDIKNISKVTIAGQTAPSPITIVGNTVQITSSSGSLTSDIVMRYIAVRKGAGDGEDAVSIKGSGTTRNIILDHISASWSEDEVISVTQKATNVTVQNSIMSEALNPSGHAYGSLIRPTVNSQVSYHHNLYSSNKSRNPRPGTYDGATLEFDFRNNVIYNWSDRAGYTGGASEPDVEHVYMNYVGNYLVAGPSTPSAARATAFTKDASNDPLDLKVYQSGNRIDSTAGATRDGIDTGWAMFANWNGSVMSAFPDADKREAAFAYPFGTTDSAEDAYARVIASVGSFPWARGITDRRLINDVRNYTGAVVNAVPQQEWNELLNAPMTSRPAGWDTDRDGMPNYWEAARGLNPNVADNNGVGPNQYTHLENYLHHLTLQATWNLDANGEWSQFLNWAGTLPDAIDATAHFAQGITAPRTVTVSSPRTVGQIIFASPVAYTLAGTGTITFDVYGSGTAEIQVTAGEHTIATPIGLNENLNITAAAGSGLTLSGAMNAAGKTINKLGEGAVQVQQLRAAAVNINAGTLSVNNGPQANHPDGTSVLQSLTISPGARLDLNNNSLILNTASLATVTGLVKTALDNGGNFDWQGPGIGSTQAHVQNTAAGSFLYGLGVVLNDLAQVGGSGPIYTAFGGQTTSGGEVLVKFTYFGDADLSGSIDATDYSLIDNGYVNSLSGWINGDFDYSGVIDATDYALIDNAYVNQVGALAEAIIAEHAKILGGEYLAALRAVQSGVIPEPAALGALSVSGIWSLKRPRR